MFSYDCFTSDKKNDSQLSRVSVTARLREQIMRNRITSHPKDQLKHECRTLLQRLGPRPDFTSLSEGLPELGNWLMGRRDKRTWRGKIFKGSFGKVRPKKQHSSNGWWNKPADELNPIPIPYPPRQRRSPAPPEKSEQQAPQLACC